MCVFVRVFVVCVLVLLHVELIRVIASVSVAIAKFVSTIIVVLPCML